MKKIMFALLMVISTISYSQQFDGVSISGSLSSVVKNYQNRGYVIRKKINPYCTVLVGRFLGDDIELFINATPKTFKVFKVTVFLPEKESWYSLKNSFNKYFGVLDSKYGDYDNIYTYFDKPYYEGDGYEMSAITLDKCHYSAFWLNRNNTSIGLFISKWKQIQIDYENDSNVKLNESETKLSINDSF